MSKNLRKPDQFAGSHSFIPFTSPTGKDCDPFDPNGAIFWQGRYHLGYIIGNQNECKRHFWWGHVSSTDLVNWRLHPPMLGPYPGDPDEGIFSGNGLNAGNCIAAISGSLPSRKSRKPSPPVLYKCTDDDQSDWTLVGDFLSHDMPEVESDEDISCPDLFSLGDRRVLLCMSHKRGARYYLGRFEDEQFHPEDHFRMNWPGGACLA